MNAPSLAALQEELVRLLGEIQLHQSDLDNDSRNMKIACGRIDAIHHAGCAMDALQISGLVTAEQHTRFWASSSLELAYWLKSYEESVPPYIQRRADVERLRRRIHEVQREALKYGGVNADVVRAVMGKEVAQG